MRYITQCVIAPYSEQRRLFSLYSSDFHINSIGIALPTNPEITRARAYMLSRQRPVLWFGNLTVMIVCCVVL